MQGRRSEEDRRDRVGFVPQGGDAELARFVDDGLRPDGHSDVHGNGVLRLPEALSHRQRRIAVVLFVVPRYPRLLIGAELHRERGIVKGLVQRQAGLHGGGVHDWLEARARLPECLRHAIELGIAEVAAADHGDDIAGLRLEHHRAALQIRRLAALGVVVRLLLHVVAVGLVREPADAGDGVRLDLFELYRQRVDCRLLGVEIERGIDAQPAGIHLAAKLRLDDLAHVFDEILRHILIVAARRQGQRKGLPSLGFFRRQVAGVAHRFDYYVAASHGRRRMLARVVGLRRLRQRRQARRFRHVNTASRLAEIASRGSLDAVGAVAEVDLVQVELEDLALGELLFERLGDANLANLPRDPLDAANLPVDLLGEEVAGELHGDGREALAQAVEEHDVLERAEEADPVHAVMLIEPLVLDRQEGGGHRRRHRREWQHGPAGVAEIADLPAIGGVNPGRLVLVIAVDARDGGAAVVGAGTRPHADQQEGEKHRPAEEGESDIAAITGVLPETADAGHTGRCRSSHGHEAIRGAVGLHG